MHQRSSAERKNRALTAYRGTCINDTNSCCKFPNSPSLSCVVRTRTVPVLAINMRSVSPLKRRIVRLGNQQPRGTSIHPKTSSQEKRERHGHRATRKASRRQMKRDWSLFVKCFARAQGMAFPICGLSLLAFAAIFEQ